MKRKLFIFAIAAFLYSGILNSGFAQVITPIDTGFITPIGITADLKGNLWVSEPGTGNNDSRVSLVKTNGKSYTTIRNLPSYKDPVSGEVSGVWRSYFLADGSVLVVSGAGIDPNSASLMYFDFKGWTPGVDTPKTLSDARNVIHIGEFLLKNGFTDTDPYDVAWDPTGNLYVSDAGANAVVKVDLTDSLSVLDTFPHIPNIYTAPPPPFIDAVPTVIRNNPDGGFYLSFLTGFPFVSGISSIVNLQTNGDTSLYATGLTQVVDMTVDSVSHKVYALQFADYDASANPIPGTAKIVRIDSLGNHVVATGFGPAAGMVEDGAGGFYVTSMDGKILHIFDIATDVPVLKNDVSLNVIASPNPFSNNATVQFHLNHASDVQFSVMNVMGETLLSKSVGNFTSGDHTFNWDGKNNDGKKLPAGVYFIQVSSADGAQSARVVMN